MPTIQQLPTAPTAGAADEIPLSQSGTTKSVTVTNLLSGTQSAITLPSGDLLGRVSLGTGGPEPVAVGVGLTISTGTLVATGADHVLFPVSTTISPGDLVVKENQGTAGLLPVAAFRSLFFAGANIAIDVNGTISASSAIPGPVGPAGSSTSISTAPIVMSVGPTDLVGISQSGVDRAIPVAKFFTGAAFSGGTADGVVIGSLTPTSAAFSTITTGPSNVISGPAGTYRNWQFNSGVLPRWQLGVTADGETGLNVGSNLYINAYKDDGTYDFSPLYISRNTGGLTLNGPMTHYVTGTAIANQTVGRYTKVSNVGSPPVSGVRTDYLSTNTTPTGLQFDIADSIVARWDNAGSGSQNLAVWRVALSPLDSTQTWSTTIAEFNPVNRGDDPGYTSAIGTRVRWVGGLRMVPEAITFGAPGTGGNILFSYSTAASGGTNANGVHAKTYNGYLVEAESIAPSGRGIRLDGASISTPAQLPYSPLELGYNWSTGLRFDQSTLRDGNAIVLGTNQAIALTPDYVHRLTYSTNGLSYAVNGSEVFAVSDTGTLSHPLTSTMDLATSFNLTVGGSPRAADGSGVIAIRDATAVPVSSPPSGAVLYCQSGQLLCRFTSGRTVVLATG